MGRAVAVSFKHLNRRLKGDILVEEGQGSSPLETGTEGDLKGELMPRPMQLIVEEALEAKPRELVGRDHYERGAEADRGYRNGYRELGLRTGEGEARFAVPLGQGMSIDLVRPRASPRRTRRSVADAIDAAA